MRRKCSGSFVRSRVEAKLAHDVAGQFCSRRMYETLPKNSRNLRVEPEMKEVFSAPCAISDNEDQLKNAQIGLCSFIKEAQQLIKDEGTLTQEKKNIENRYASDSAVAG
jgi:hypothetical protein